MVEDDSVAKGDDDVEYSRTLSLLHSSLIELILPLPAGIIADGESKYHICFPSLFFPIISGSVIDMLI